MTNRVDVGEGVSIAYEQIGGPHGVPLILIAGLGQQRHVWPDELRTMLGAHGYLVTCFDNRDAGQSTHSNFPPPHMIANVRRHWHRNQYDLADMAADTVGLLDALGLDSAHLVGISMGGMIAQTVAARHPDRVRTLTSIMSTTGARRIGRPALSTWLRMLSRPARSQAEYADRLVRMYRHIGSSGYPLEEKKIRDYAAVAWDRDPSTAGLPRQLAAIFRSGDRSAELGLVSAPTLVIHGDQDRMINPTGGVHTAKAIPGARLVTLPGMGHDLPRGIWPTLVNLIDDHIHDSTTRISHATKR